MYVIYECLLYIYVCKVCMYICTYMYVCLYICIIFGMEYYSTELKYVSRNFNIPFHEWNNWSNAIHLLL